MSRIAKLPAGYRQVEYIESSGEQYIDTGFKPNQDTSIIVDIAFNTTTTQGAYGARTSGSSKAFTLIWMTNGYYRFYYNNGYNNFTAGITDPTVRHTIKHEKNVLTIGDATLSRTYAAFQCDYNLYLFAHNQAGTVNHPASAKLYACQIYDNSVLARDFVPCITISGEAGLYDLVYGVFYGNSGTGVFAVGRNVYSEDEITKLEYVESTGEQYVDTGLKPVNNNIRVVMEFSTAVSGVSLFGCQTAWGSASFSFGSQTASYGTYGNTSLNYYDGVRHIVDFNKGTLRVDGTQVFALSQTFSIALNLFVLANNGNSTIYYSTAKLYSCQIYDNGTLARDYIPATVNGEVGLWDACSGVLYTSGSGTALIAGPEIETAPSTPSDLEILEHTDTSVMLGWSEVANALGYRVYKNGSLYSDQTATEFSDEVTPYQSVEYGVSAYNDKGEGKTALLTVYISPDNPIPYLITDRKQADADRVAALALMDYKNMTDSERAEWDSDLKGAYNASDLNRVEGAVAYLAEALRVLPVELRDYAENLDVGWDKYFDVPYGSDAHAVSTKENWTLKAVPTPADMERYLANVVKLRNTLEFASDALPQTMNDLRWQSANAIESALKNLDIAIALFKENTQIMIVNTAAAWAFSGEVFMGEV